MPFLFTVDCSIKRIWMFHFVFRCCHKSKHWRETFYACIFYPLSRKTLITVNTKRRWWWILRTLISLLTFWGVCKYFQKQNIQPIQNECSRFWSNIKADYKKYVKKCFVLACPWRSKIRAVWEKLLQFFATIVLMAFMRRDIACSCCVFELVETLVCNFGPCCLHL